MTRKRLALSIVLVSVLAALGSSVGWAATRGGTPAWMPGHVAGMGMMGGQPTGAANPVTSLAEAKRDAQAFAAGLGLDAGEVMQFERNYYVKLVDAAGAGATELLVDPATGYVSIEYGPAMMWNTRYGMASGRFGTMMGGTGMMGHYGAGSGSGKGTGMMGSSGAGWSGAMGGTGMMGGTGTMRGAGMMSGAGTMNGAGMMGGRSTASPQGATGSPLSIAEARARAQRWLDANDGGVKVEPGGDSFPGYFTFETLRDGRITGMISVNSTSAAVLQHWWHGAFVAAA